MNRCKFEYTVGLSKLLQGSTQEVLLAYNEVTLVKEIFIDIRKNADAEYSEIYKMTEEMANIAGTVISIPRRCRRQTTRNNVESDTPEICWRRIIFLPFLDNLLQEFDTRLSVIIWKAVLGLNLLPNNVGMLTDANINKNAISMTCHPQHP